MSPSIEDFEKRMGRPLMKGDTFVSMSTGSGRDLIFEEVIDPSVEEDPKRIRESSGFRENRPAVKIRELTSVGPMSDYDIRERNSNYMGMIELNNRTDLSKLQKLILEIRSLIK